MRLTHFFAAGRGTRRATVSTVHALEALEGRALLSSSRAAWLPLNRGEVRRAEVASASRFMDAVSAKVTHVERDIPFTSETGRVLALDVYTPAGQAPIGGWPLVLAIHGGGWRRFDKSGYGSRVAALTRFGYAVVAPNYTLSNPGVPSWPDNLLDLQGALRWVRSHADGFALDPDRVATMGESAGGHLALMSGFDDSNPPTRIRAVVNFFGPTDLGPLARQSLGAAAAVQNMLGVSPRGDSPLLAQASPVEHITAESPPVLTVHGRNDRLVPVSQARRLDQVLAAAGVPHGTLLLKGQGHGFGFGARDGLLADIVSFLDQYLGVYA